MCSIVCILISSIECLGKLKCFAMKVLVLVLVLMKVLVLVFRDEGVGVEGLAMKVFKIDKANTTPIGPLVLSLTMTSISCNNLPLLYERIGGSF